MATARKIDRKQLKKPDEFVQTGQSVLGWALENKALVSAVGGGVLLLGLGISLGAWWSEKTATEASLAMGDAIAVATRPVIESDAPKSDDPYFPSEEAKVASARESYEAVRVAHPGSEAAAMAALKLGDLALTSGDLAAAKARYDDFLVEAGAGNTLRYAAYEGRAYAFEAEGDLDGALEAIERMLEDSGTTFYRPFALVQQARLLKALGRGDEARVAAQEVVDSFAESPARAHADRLLEGLPAAPASSEG